jgi:hypothetical protein
MAVEAKLAEGSEPASEVGDAVPDGDVDIAWPCVAQVHVPRAGAGRGDEVHNVSAGSGDVAEVHDHTDRGVEPLVQSDCSLGVVAEPEVVQ